MGPCPGRPPCAGPALRSFWPSRLPPPSATSSWKAWSSLWPGERTTTTAWCPASSSPSYRRRKGRVARPSPRACSSRWKTRLLSRRFRHLRGAPGRRPVQEDRPPGGGGPLRGDGGHRPRRKASPLPQAPRPSGLPSGWRSTAVSRTGAGATRWWRKARCPFPAWRPPWTWRPSTGGFPSNP